MRCLNYFVILFLIQIILVSCPDGKFVLDKPVGATIGIQNNADYGLYLYAATGDIPPVYPDTTLPFQKPNTTGNTKFFKYIPPHIKQWPVDTKKASWTDIFKSLPKDTLSVFLFNADTLDLYSWDQIRINYEVLKRYDLSQEDLKRMNYRIIYP